MHVLFKESADAVHGCQLSFPDSTRVRQTFPAAYRLHFPRLLWDVGSMIKCLAGLLVFLILSVTAQAQTPIPASEKKINDLVALLQDPDIQAWLESRKTAAAPPAPSATAASPITSWESETRARIDTVIAAVPRIPSEIAATAARTRADAISHGYAPVFVIFGGLIAIGLAAEWLYRRMRGQREGAAAALIPIVIFAGSMAVIFFAIEWPPLARITLLVYLSAFVVYRTGSVLITLAAPEGLRRRARILLGITVLAIATAALGPPLGTDPAVTDAISYVFSIIVLALGIEAVWSAWSRPKPAKAIVTGVMVAMWILWCLDLKGLFWLGLYALILPGILRGAGNVAEHFTSAGAGLRNVLVVRGARAIVIAIAAGWLAIVWQMNPETIGHRDPIVSAIFYGLLRSVVVLLAADLIWHLAKSWIDGNLVASAPAASTPADTARRARFRTLLPILRNALAVMIAVMAALIILAQLGVEIGPLIAGAGIFGVALGFGSQTLVKDIISGVFYMLDDAFRVGEYIQAKNYKGTVEGFSLRSVRLRHHRGPVFTVPFGELGAVENMSRDWVIDKFRISVGFDTDVEKARKLTKKIGAELLEDPELGPLFIEPLKMKGVEEFGDYGIVLGFGMTTVPGMQTYIRRKAQLRIREAFRANGIEFAQPTVNVGGDEREGGAAAAAATVKAQQAKAAAAAEV